MSIFAPGKTARRNTRVSRRPALRPQIPKNALRPPPEEGEPGAHSSVGQSSGLIIRRSWDHAPLGPHNEKVPMRSELFRFCPPPQASASRDAAAGDRPRTVACRRQESRHLPLSPCRRQRPARLPFPLAAPSPEMRHVPARSRHRAGVSPYPPNLAHRTRPVPAPPVLLLQFRTALLLSAVLLFIRISVMHFRSPFIDRSSLAIYMLHGSPPSSHSMSSTPPRRSTSAPFPTGASCSAPYSFRHSASSPHASPQTTSPTPYGGAPTAWASGSNDNENS